MFKSIVEAVSWLESQSRFRPKTSLDYILNAYNLLDLDFSKTKKIHVAGTNGKGSTSAFITKVLVDNNISVGTFTSPYLVTFNERIRVNNKNISDKDLLNNINYFYQLNEELYSKYEYRLSFFEIITLMSLKHFSDSKVEVIVIEVGIGGRLDATNILEYDVSIITSIGLDHMTQLGDTLELITNEKLGILKPKGYLVSAVEAPIKTQMINYANKLKVKHKFVKSRDIFAVTPNSFYYLDQLFEVGLLGDYQRKNALIAYYAVKHLFKISDDKIIESLKSTKWDGRLEEVFPDVYLDGAHNIPAMEALMRNIEYIFKDKKITILFSALKDKEIAKMLEEITKYNYDIVLTSFPDFRFQNLKDYSNDRIKYLEDGYKTFKKLVSIKKEDEVIIATGSLHFIGYLKQNINNN
ncbi:MAG TPA: Mur ligase family protein [Haploplasma sp.]|nr:Mur ligase family protein [Haploplasma sp.]